VVTRTSSKMDKAVLPLVIVGVVAFTLAGMAVLVSANSQVPHFFRELQPASHSAIDSLQREIQADRLKRNATSLLRSLPGYSSSFVRESALVREPSSGDVKAEVPVKTVDVNTFLLSRRMTNQSQLAELQMQAFFAEFNAGQFIQKALAANAQPGVGFTGVGFPHIETGNRADDLKYKPYKQLLSFSTTSNGVIVPNVRCMGLSAESVAKRAKKYDARIFELAVKHKVSVSLVKAVVAKESCFDASARSPVGAIGLMQLMPATARWLKVSKPESVNQNLSAGVRYLAQLRKRFGSDELALAAYNAGPGNVERYQGIPPFEETQNYVQDVMHFYRGYVATTRFINALNDFAE